jgi:predicted nucleotidyltransferase
MAELYTPQRRAEIQENLLTFLQTDEQIAGVVLVGSGAEEYRDSYSDINLLIAVADNMTVYAVYHKWKTRLIALYPRIAGYEIQQANEAFHYTSLLDNFLVLDLQFAKARRTIAHHKPWKICFDRTGTLQETLEKAYSDEQNEAPLREYTRLIDTIWQPILKCATALRRNEIWRALHLLEGLRNQVVEIAGMNHNIDTHDFTDVDRLPEMFLVHLRHTLPTGTGVPAIRRALRTTVVLLFDEIEALETRLAVSKASTLRGQMLAYLEAYS